MAQGGTGGMGDGDGVPRIDRGTTCYSVPNTENTYRHRINIKWYLAPLSPAAHQGVGRTKPGSCKNRVHMSCQILVGHAVLTQNVCRNKFFRGREARFVSALSWISAWRLTRCVLQFKKRASARDGWYVLRIVNYNFSASKMTRKHLFSSSRTKLSRNMGFVNVTATISFCYAMFVPCEFL